MVFCDFNVGLKKELIQSTGSSKVDSRLAPSQWDTSLQSNAVSHWLGANLESALPWLQHRPRNTTHTKIRGVVKVISQFRGLGCHSMTSNLVSISSLSRELKTNLKSNKEILSMQMQENVS